MKKIVLISAVFLLCFAVCFFWLEARSSSCEHSEEFGLNSNSQSTVLPPKNVTVQTLSSTSVRVSWQDTTQGEESFRVYRQGALKPIAETGPAPLMGKTMSVDIAELSCGVTYSFFVRVVFPGGRHADSDIVAAKTACLIPPSNVSAQARSTNSIALNWYDNNSDEKGYRIYRPGKLRGPELLRTTGAYPGTGANVSISFDDKECNTAYKFFVRSFNDDGESADSKEVSATTYPCPYKTVEVQFTNIYVLNDTDPAGTGELWFDFFVNGKTQRYPASGTVSIGDNQNQTINPYFILDLATGEELKIRVQGTDDDAPLANESLGTADYTKMVSTLPADYGNLDISSEKDRVVYFKAYFKVRARDKRIP
jgi:hypothetical protein